MEIDQDHILISQLPLFDSDEPVSELLELFPSVWIAAENLSSTSLERRNQALEYLKNTNAAKISPLIAYILYTRIDEPDLKLRAQVVGVLSEVVSSDPQGRQALETVRHHLSAHLARMRTREIYSLLQVLLLKAEYLQVIARLLNACPYAGNQLADLASSRKAPIEIRCNAIQLIGEVGYLDAVPTLERLLERTESRVSGQQLMPFAPPMGVDETELLPVIKIALDQLRSP